MPPNDTASQLAAATDAIRGESRWLREQSGRVASSMDAAHLIMSAAWKHIRELEAALKPFAGLPETSEAETAIPNDSPVTIRCQLGDMRRAFKALNP